MKVYSTSVPELGTWALKDRENVITLNTAPNGLKVFTWHFSTHPTVLRIPKNSSSFDK